jgi:hypothetical protein
MVALVFNMKLHVSLLAAVACLLGLLAVVPGAQAFKVVIAPGKTECIAETIDSEHFQVLKARVLHQSAEHEEQLKRDSKQQC